MRLRARFRETAPDSDSDRKSGPKPLNAVDTEVVKKGTDRQLITVTRAIYRMFRHKLFRIRGMGGTEGTLALAAGSDVGE